MVAAFAACQPETARGSRIQQSEAVPTAILKKRKNAHPAPSGSRVENAYAALKSAIRENVYPPGHFAAENEVAVQLGMSRTPVHEAAIRLQEEGLIKVLPRRGILVCAISHRDIRETYELTIALESMAAEVLAARPSSSAVSKTIARLEAETKTMESALRKNDLDKWAAADDRFHEILTGECGNGRLSRMASTIRDQTHRARLLTLRLRPLPVKSAPEHWAIIEAIRKGNPSAAARMAGAHRRRASEIMIPLLEKFSTPNA
jgi:DNA-binding GntR family transcriptional regulator